MSGPGKTQQSIRAHLVAIGATAVFLVGGVGVIGATTDLAGAVIAAGTLVVESNVKKVQHPTGGIVGDLLVHDGSRVEAGELLVRLDETTAQANLAMVDKSLAELFARRARLDAERDGADTVEFPDELLQAARQAEIARVVAGERKLFQLRREAQDGQKAQLRERIVQLNEEVRGYTDQAGAKAKEIEFIQKELEGVRELWQKNLVPITRVTALERDGARLEGERGQLIATVAQGKGKVSETELQIIQIDQNLRSDVAKELADIRAQVLLLIYWFKYVLLDVAAAVDFLAVGLRLQLLGRHVVQRAHDLVLAGERHGERGVVGRWPLGVRGTQLRKAEIQQLDAGLGDEDIRGLQVAMGDALLVRGVERVANLHRVLQRLIDRQRPLERRALDVLHHQVIRPDIVKLADVRMIQRRDGAGFALETLAELGLGNLDGDDAIKARVAGLIHFAHPAGAERGKDFVRAEFVAGRERHVRDSSQCT